MSDPRMFRNHATSRVRKRFDLKLTQIDKEAITSMLNRGRYVWLNSDNRVNVVAVWYAGKWMPLVTRGYDIVTVLPKEELEKNKSKLLASNLYREIEDLPPKEKEPSYKEFKLAPKVATNLKKYFSVRLRDSNLVIEDNWLKGFELDFQNLANRIVELSVQNSIESEFGQNLEELAWALREFTKEKK